MHTDWCTPKFFCRYEDWITIGSRKVPNLDLPLPLVTSTLPENIELHLKHWDWKMKLLLERPPARCYASFREGSSPTNIEDLHA